MSKKYSNDDPERFARINIYTRPNFISGRYAKGGFNLDFYNFKQNSKDLHLMIERADIADELISKAHSEGKNIDDPDVLMTIACKFNKSIESKKRSGLRTQKLIYLIISGVIILWLFLT